MTKPGLSIQTGIRPIVIFLISLLTFTVKSEAQDRKKVEILRCDMLDHNNRIVANAQRLLGNVNITVDGALMWCDSLYSYNNNTVDAFGNVHIVRGDTLDMYADFINYSPETKLAKARRNVKLIDKKVTLYTDSLDYSMTNDLASYNYQGTVKDSTNVLTSKIGQYFVNQKKAYFKTKVDVVTKDYKIKSDTLIYVTNTKTVFLEGPTHIFNESDTLYAESGWYDSTKNQARLTKKPKIWNIKQNMRADSIFYDKKNGEGLAMGHAHLQDVENSMIVVGNLIKYNDLTKIASATDSAMLIQYSKTDSLFLHADLLQTMPDTTLNKKTNTLNKNQAKISTQKTFSDSLALEKPMLLKKRRKKDNIETLSPDSLTTVKPLPKDSLSIHTAVVDTLESPKKKDARLVLAYHKVRFYRKDFQGKCDSLAYWSKDSTIQFFTDPVLWANKNQMSANYIEMINRTKDPDEIRMKDDAFIISMEDDSLRFNQIKGKNMIGFVLQNNLYKIDVNGNGQSNYYARDKGGIIGLNKAESSNIRIYMNEGKDTKISFIKAPEGELKPTADIEDNDKLLPGFKWQDESRPKNKEDIFRVPVPVAIPSPNENKLLPKPSLTKNQKNEKIN